MIAFIEDDDEPVPKPVKEDESKKAFEILDLLKVEINEVKKRVVRKKKTEI
jgi:hypothetical protein